MTRSERGSQLEAISPQGHLGMSGDISAVTTGVATDKDADEHHTMHRTVNHETELRGSK